MFSIRDMTPLSLASTLAVPSLGLLSLIAMLILRFQRRGGARFWAVPAHVALCLLPGVVGAGLTVLLFRQSLAGLAPMASLATAALAAGSAEALLPLLVGTLVVAALALFALLITPFCTTREARDATERAGVGWGLLASTLLGLLFTSAMVALIVRMVASVDRGLADTHALRLQLNLSLAGAGLIALAWLALLILTVVWAPRQIAPLGLKLGSLACFPLCAALALAGGWATYVQFDCLTSTALTGLACDALPEPATLPTPEPPVAPPPPPPPPPPRADRSSRPNPNAAEPDDAGALRVGGNIAEPRKVKHVDPRYPDIARLAGLQGVVILQCTISPSGKVTSVKVLRGIPLLDQAAIEAVSQWIYTPLLVDGVAMPVIMTVTVNFKLD